MTETAIEPAQHFMVNLQYSIHSRTSDRDIQNILM